MTYQSVTTWQANEFEVEVRYGFFSTVEAAADMARRGIKGIFIDGLSLWVELRDNTQAPVREGSFIVRRLREGSHEAASHRMLSSDDFEVIDMNIDSMRKEPAMRSFGSQAYSVIDASGRPVDLPC